MRILLSILVLLIMFISVPKSGWRDLILVDTEVMAHATVTCFLLGSQQTACDATDLWRVRYLPARQVHKPTMRARQSAFWNGDIHARLFYQICCPVTVHTWTWLINQTSRRNAERVYLTRVHNIDEVKQQCISSMIDVWDHGLDQRIIDDSLNVW